MTGYESKRAAARGKLDDDDTQVYQDDALTIAYQSGFYDGKKAAQRPWVGLTDDAEIFAAVRHLYGSAESAFMARIDDIATARAIEAALRSKNT